MHRTISLADTVFNLEQLGKAGIAEPQIAFAGRSNVGKSSLINCLGGRKGLARVSSTPGKTRSINFYQVQPGSYYLADLPGYGYARCSKAERQKWAELIEGYLAYSPTLAGIVVLLDSRIEPQRLDLEMTSYVRGIGVELIAVLTKADKVKQRDQAKRQSQWREILRTQAPPLLFSSKTGRGRDQLWSRLDKSVEIAMGRSVPGVGPEQP